MHFPLFCIDCRKMHQPTEQRSISPTFYERICANIIYILMKQNWVQKSILAPFLSSILGRDLNPQPYDCEPNSLTTD